MRTLFRQISLVIILSVSLCSIHASLALSSIERCVMSAACIGVTYGVGRLTAWVSIWEAGRRFAQEIDQFTLFYGSQEEAKQQLQDIILLKHSNECSNMHYYALPLLWYKELVDTHINRLRFWRMVTIGSSDWTTIHNRIDQLYYLRNLVITNYLYIDELRAFTDNQQRYYTV